MNPSPTGASQASPAAQHAARQVRPSPAPAAAPWADVLAWSWLVALTVATLLPAEHLPAVPGSDKTQHLLAYGGLCLLAGWNRPGLSALLRLFVAATLFGGMVELLQPYVNRWGEWGDFFANAAGATLGCMLAHGLHRLRRRSNS